MDQCGCRSGANFLLKFHGIAFIARAAGEAMNVVVRMTIPSLSFASPEACIAGLAGPTASVSTVSKLAPHG
jgi:hypothetical protein